MDKHVNKLELEELVENSLGGSLVGQEVMSLIQGVGVSLDVKVGSAEMTVAELFDLKVNSLVKLSCTTESPVDVMLNGKVVARGSLMVVDENFGVQITEILD